VRRSLLDQVQRNSVALISLVVAITSLVYNTWRNEFTEFNRNQRQSSFDTLAKLGELQELAFLNHFDCNFSVRGNVRSGWVLVQTIEDLTMVLDELSMASTQNLKEVWAGNWEALSYENTAACENRSEARRAKGREAADAVAEAIDGVRHDVLAVLRSLD